MSTYMKAIVAVLTGVSTWGVTAVADGHVDAVELFGLLGVVAAGLGVYGARNAPDPAEPPGDDGHSDLELPR